MQRARQSQCAAERTDVVKELVKNVEDDLRDYGQVLLGQTARLADQQLSVAIQRKDLAELDDRPVLRERIL
jgi:hypothetical protein